MHENAKPILFSTDMVRQLPPHGIKSQTRRVVKIPTWTTDSYDDLFVDASGDLCATCDDTGCSVVIKPRYQPGDIMWVRETWCNVNKPGIVPEYYYFADTKYAEDYDSSEWKWRPSIHMPREAARIFLRVKRVWAERVQEISEADAMAEGIDWFSKDGKLKKYAPADSEGDGPVWPWQECPRSPIGAYQKLWDEINAKRDGGKYAWAANPWVWCYEFERLEG